MTNGQQPVKKWRAGANVSCAIWQNEVVVNGQARRMYKVTLEKRFRDKGTGRWGSTNSLSREDVPYAIYCLQQAFAGMIDLAESQRVAGGSEEAPDEAE